jgi:hypothetical protein
MSLVLKIVLEQPQSFKTEASTANDPQNAMSAASFNPQILHASQMRGCSAQRAS